MTTCLELTLRAIPASVGNARRTVAGIAERLGADEGVIDDVRLAVTEAVTNAVHHAYGAEGGDLELRMLREADALVVCVRDRGTGFPGVEARAERGLGLGLTLIERVTEHFEVSSEPGSGTEVRMTFPLVHPREAVVADAGGPFQT